MSFIKIIYLFLFVIKLSSQQRVTSRMKWCLDPKFVSADNKDVDIDTCKERPCIIGTCPYLQMNYKRYCVPMTNGSFSDNLSLYRMESGKPVNTGKLLINDKYQFVTLKDRKAHMSQNNNCTTGFITLGENARDGHFLEDGSFLYISKERYTIIPAGEYVVRFITKNVTGKIQQIFLIKFAKDIARSKFDMLMDCILDYVMLVSVLFMILLLIVYVLCKELRSTAGLILMTYVTALALSFLLNAIRELIIYYGSISPVGCYVISTLAHFFTLSSCIWMNIMGFDIWWTLRHMHYGGGVKRGVNYIKFTWYCCIAFLPPLVYVVIEVCLDEFTETYGPKFKDCTVGCNKWYLAGLSLPLQTFNFIPFVLTVFNLWRIQKSTQTQLNNCDSGNTGPAKHNALLSIKISVMMGTNWFMDVMLLIFSDDMPFQYIPKTYNSLFGVILFLVYIFKWDVLLKLFKRLSIDNGITRHLERRVSKQSSYKSRNWSQHSSSSATVMQQVSSQPDTDDGHMVVNK